jgi:tetratricopeptide (TPR) repeat protein
MPRISALILAVVLVLGGLLCPAAVFAQSQQDAIRLHREAYQLQENAQSHADMKQAEEKFLRAIAIYQRVGERENLGLAYNSVSIIYENWGQYDKAVEYYEKSLAIKRELKDRKGEGHTLLNLGRANELRGQYAEALKNYELGLSIWQAIGVPVKWPKDLIGNVCIETGDMAKAESFIKEANYSRSFGRLYLLKSQYPQAQIAVRKTPHIR